MTAMTATTQAIIEWINDTRQHAPVLDNDADALLARVNAAQAREQAIDRALASRAVSGFTGILRRQKRICWPPCAVAATPA
jgi:hypothetical protein